MYTRSNKSFDPNSYALRVRRFWYWINGSPVKITIKLGETITIETGGSHEEGWSREVITFHVWNGCVLQDVYTDGQDCDGRISTSASLRCPFDQLQAVPGCEDAEKILGPSLWPKWQRVKSGQRDYSAEAAGY
jgi:hypothetical protein